MKHYNHIIRAGVVLVIVVAAFFGVRMFLVPDSFGIHGTYTYGYHRGESDGEQAALPALFQGSEKCRKCHEDRFAQWEKNGHAAVTCEACHGNWQAHNNNTKDEVLKDVSVEACLLCHQRLAARPYGFPQIDGFTQHMQDQDEQVEQGTTCTGCHDPHEPM